MFVSSHKNISQYGTHRVVAIRKKNSVIYYIALIAKENCASLLTLYGNFDSAMKGHIPKVYMILLQSQ